MNEAKLFLVHCGFYDAEIGDGIFEGHVNYFVTAPSAEAARAKAKELAPYKTKRMHVDGIQEIEAVEGFRIKLERDDALAGASLVRNTRHRDLAPKPAV